MFRLFGRSSDERDNFDDAAPAQSTLSILTKSTASKSRPKTWVFRGYQLVREPRTGTWCVFESRERFDPVSARYEANERPIRTAIAVPSELMATLGDSPRHLQEVTEYCEIMRRRLDQSGGQGGLKLLFDRLTQAEAATQSWQPKWKYQVEPPPSFRVGNRRTCERLLQVEDADWHAGRKRVEDPDALPKNLHGHAIGYWEMRSRGSATEEYWRGELWRDWFGKAIQRKRESIISEELTTWAAAIGAPLPQQPPDPKSLADALPVARNLVALFLTANHQVLDREHLLHQVADSTATVLRNLWGDREPLSGTIAEISLAAARMQIAEILPEENPYASAPLDDEPFVILLERDAIGGTEAALLQGLRRLVRQTLEQEHDAPQVDRIAQAVTVVLLANPETEALALDAQRGTLRVKDVAKLRGSLQALRQRIVTAGK